MDLGGNNMQKYVDGFVLVVPKDKVEEYKKMAEVGRNSWMKHGALGYYECRGNDLTPQEMGDEKGRSFTEMAGAKDPDEAAVSDIKALEKFIDKRYTIKGKGDAESLNLSISAGILLSKLYGYC